MTLSIHVTPSLNIKTWLTFALLMPLSLGLTGCFGDDEEEAKAPDSVVAAQVVESSVESKSDEPESFEASDISGDATQIHVLDISERTYDGGGALAVTFSSPVDASQKIQSFFDVTQGGDDVSGEWVLSESGKVAYFDSVEPRTMYRVSVAAGLPAKSGKLLNRGASGEVKTRDVKPAVNFSGQNIFLTKAAQTGLPVTTINVSEVDVNFYRIPLDEINRVSRFLGYQTADRYRLNNLKKWTEHLHFARYTLPAPKNKRRDINLPIQDIEALQKPGVYMAIMSRVGDYYDDVMPRIFTVTDIGLHARFYGSKVKVYTSSLETAKPLGNIRVSILDRKGRVQDDAMTNSKGEVLVDLEAGRSKKGDARFIVASNKQSMSFISVQKPALDLSEFELNKRPFRPFEFFIYGSRDLYRPGEVVRFSGLLRNFDGRLDKTLPMQSVLRDATGKSIKKFSWKGNAQGYYETQYALPSNAATGNWTLEVKNTDGSLITHRFKVEEFMPERLKLTFDGERFQWGETIKAKLNAMYLYGAAASNNRVQGSVYFRNERHPIDSLKDFYFGNVTQTYSSQETLDDQYLDDKGNTTLRIKSPWNKVESPVSVVFSGSVFESGGRSVTRHHKAILMPARKMLGIRPDFLDKNPEQNTEVGFQIVYAGVDGEKFGLADVEVRLVREDRNYYWEYSRHRGWHYQYNDQEYVVQNQRISIPKGKTARITAPVEYGYYRLEAVDSRSQIVSSVRFYAGYNWYEDWQNNQSAGRAAHPDKVSLAFNQDSYESGDDAVLSIVPPDAGESLIMVESDELLWYKRVKVPKEGKKVEIPIKRSWNRHDLYVSVVHLQPTQTAKNITAKRSVGLIHLPLNRESKKLDVMIDAPEKTKPNRTQMVKVKVKGKSKKVHLTLSAVDVGVLNITRFKTPDPFTYFFEPRRYQVDMRDMYQKLFDINKNELAKQRFGGDMMADMADDELSKGGKNAQAEVRVMSLFSGVVKVNSKGYAEIPLELPDFNGRVRLMAIAFSDDAYGASDKEMTIAAPLVTQISMPRFLAMGDESNFALDLHNLTTQSQTITVNLNSQGPVSIDGKPSKLQLKPKEKTTLVYPVKAKYEAGRSAITLSIDGLKDYPINREWGLFTRAAYPALSERKQQWVKPNESMTLKGDTLKDWVPSTLEAVLRVSNSADLNLPQHLNYLLSYPYGCTEQSVSSTYPWLYATPDNMRALGLSSKIKYSREDSLKSGLKRIAQKQLSSGGYGLWSGSSPEEQWLTAYVAEFLYSAREQGVSVDKSQYDRTVSRLKRYVSNRGNRYGNSRWSEDQSHSIFSSRAYSAYVLALHKKVSLSQLRSLEKRLADAETPLSVVYLALAMQLQGDPETANKLFEKAAGMTRKDDVYYGDYGSSIRDNALMIRLFIRHGIQEERIKSLSVALADALVEQHYLSTQERNALFIAGVMLEKSYGQPWSVDLGIKDAVDTIRAKGSWAKGYTGQSLESGLSVLNKSDKDLLVTMEYQGYGKSAPKPEKSDYFEVVREYYTTDGRRVKMDELTVGDLVVVVLHVSTHKHRTPDMLVVDMLPAGLELENQNLETSVKIKDMKLDGKKLSYWQRHSALVHQEFRDDRYVAALNTSANSIFPLVYLARAVTPGTYQIPPTLVEDMYRPQRRALGNIYAPVTIKNP